MAKKIKQKQVENLPENMGDLPALTTTHKTDLVGAINEVNQKQINVNIGGRNLAIHSTSLDALPLYGVTGDYEVINDASLPSKKYFRLTNIVRTVGDYVFYIPFVNRPDLYSYNLNGVPLTISFYIKSNNNQRLYAPGWDSFDVNTVYKKIELQYTWYGSGNAHFFLEGAGLTTVEIHSLKIEIGSKATDWTPSLEEQIADFNQTDDTQYNYIKNIPLSYPPSQHNHLIPEITGLQGYLDGKVDNLNTVKALAFDSGLATGNPYFIHTNGTYVALVRLEYLELNFAYGNGGNTKGGSWKIDYILSDILSGAIGNGQVLNVLGNGTIEFGSALLNQHRFLANSIYGMVIVVPGRGAGVVWNEFNFDPNSKADVTYVDQKIAAIQIPNVANFFEKESAASSLNVNNHDLGLFTVIPTTLNLPVGQYGIVYTYKASATWWFQQFKATNGEIWERRSINPSTPDDWQPWIKTNANKNIDDYAAITYVDAKVAAIPTHNGQLTVNTTADLVGGYVYLPSGNLTTTLGLATHVLNAIADGQVAYNWGNHAAAGYTNMGAVQSWVLSQSFLTASALNGYVLQSSLNTQLANYATKAGTQTFTGTNTFTVSPVVPNGTVAGHTVNLGQMQSYVTGLGYQTAAQVTNIVNNAVAAIPTPGNGTVVLQGIGALAGTATFSMNQTNNVVGSFDLTPTTKNEIAAGATAGVQIVGLFGDCQNYFDHVDVSAGGTIDVNETFYNLLDPHGAQPTVNVTNHHVHGARLILHSYNGVGSVKYIGEFVIEDSHYSEVNPENGQKMEFTWNEESQVWIYVLPN